MNTYQPFVAVFGRNEDSSVVFTRLDAEVAIANPEGFTWEFLCLCNGQRTIQEIVEKFPFEKKNLIESIFTTLKNEKIIFDSRRVYNFFHEWSSVPMSTYSDLSNKEIIDLCNEGVELPIQVSSIKLSSQVDDNSFHDRQSVRNFTGEPLSLNELSALLFAMYGRAKFTAVPSAGSLYASIIYSVVLRDGEGIKKGVYVYDNRGCQLLKIDCIPSVEKMISLLGTRAVKDAGVILFLASDVSRISDKYSNRGYRFALLEAGHIAQNAHLSVIGTRLGLCEYGGFLDEEATRFLRIDSEKVLPLISIVVGVTDSKSFVNDSYDTMFNWLKSEVLEKRLIVDSVSYTLRESTDYKMSVYTAETVKGKGKGISYCLGTGLTPNEAMFKALAESYERYISSQVRIDIEGKLPLNAEILNLWGICPQQETYLKYFGMTQEKEKLKYWVKGSRFLGGDVYVPVDQVFFPVSVKSGESPMYLSNSTGVATHESEKNAIESAFLELIERDAIGVHWYSRKIPERIDPVNELDWIKYRVKEIEKIKRSVTFVKLTVDLTPVVMCFIVGDTYPYCVTGSSSAESHLKACEKSLTEAEITLVSFMGKRKKVIKKEKVWSVEDHAKFLACSEHSHFDWFLSGEFISISSADKNSLSIEESLQKLNPVIVILNNDIGRVMPVVRVMSEKLLPITFGIGSEHYGHPRLNDVGLKWGKYPALPHPLA